MTDPKTTPASFTVSGCEAGPGVIICDSSRYGGGGTVTFGQKSLETDSREALWARLDALSYELVDAYNRIDDIQSQISSLRSQLRELGERDV